MRGIRLNKKWKVSVIIVITIMLSLSTMVSATSQNNFSDVKEDSPHYEAIMSLSEKGIINGYEDGTFGQWEDLSRQHAAVILYKLLNLRTLAKVDEVLEQYDDVDTNSRYANEIAAVTFAGIFNGDDGKFMPNESLTREQMASILTKAFDLKEYDVDEEVAVYLGNVSASHKDSVQTLANLKFTNQLDDYRPAESTTRGAFATMVHLITTFIAEKGNQKSEKLGVAVKELPNPLLSHGDEFSVRNSETALGNLLADSILSSAVNDNKNTLIALQPSGDIHAPIEKGPILTTDVQAVLPFDKELVLIELSGTKIIKVLEESVSKVPEENTGFLQVAGLRFEFDSSEKPGERIQSVEVKKGDVHFQLENNTDYLVVTDKATANGENGYEMLSDIESTSLNMTTVKSLSEMIKRLDKVDYDIEERLIDLNDDVSHSHK